VKAVGKARRARDRDLERALEAGDFEALGEGQASVVLQPDTSTWNPHRKGAADTKQEVGVLWHRLESKSQIFTDYWSTYARFSGEDCFTQL
jgi:hypothetical protein